MKIAHGTFSSGSSCDKNLIGALEKARVGCATVEVATDAAVAPGTNTLPLSNYARRLSIYAKRMSPLTI
jgi:hypothetical protein